MRDGATTRSRLIRQIINSVLKHEGGFVDHPADRGGKTNYGITGYSWDFHCKRYARQQTPIEDITKNDAIEFYTRTFEGLGLPEIENSGLWYPIFDFYVNAGSHAIRRLQEACNYYGCDLTVDGYMGPDTIQAVNSMPKKCPIDAFINIYAAKRLSYYIDIVEHNPSQMVFLNGWLKRAKGFFYKHSG